MQAVWVVLPVFILVAIGWFLRQKGWLSPQTIKENTFFLYWIAMPCTLFNGVLKADTSVLKDVSFFAATWLPYFITPIIVWMTTCRRETNERFASIMLCSARGNNFFAGLPIVALAMGPSGTEAGMLILALTMVVMQLLSICGSQLALFGTITRKTVKSTCVQLLKNPLFIACLAGLFCVVIGLNRMPLWLDSTISMLADVSTGLALIMLGVGIHLQNFFKTAVSVWRLVLFKMMLFPAVTYAVYIYFGMSADMVQAGVLLAGMPISVGVAIVAQEMRMDYDYCAMSVTVTTLVSLFTVPVLIQLLGLV